MLGQLGGDCGPIADVSLRVRERGQRNLLALGHGHKLMTELAIAANDKDHASTPRRSPR